VLTIGALMPLSMMLMSMLHEFLQLLLLLERQGVQKTRQRGNHQRCSFIHQLCFLLNHFEGTGLVETRFLQQAVKLSKVLFTVWFHFLQGNGDELGQFGEFLTLYSVEIQLAGDTVTDEFYFFLSVIPQSLCLLKA
jgi:hypothetical protein